MSDDEQPKDDAEEAQEAGEDATGAEGGEADEKEAPQGLKAKLVAKLPKKLVDNKKLSIIVAAVLVAVIGGGAGIYFSGIFHVAKTNEITLKLPDPLVYHEVPRITVDLKPSPRHARPFIRMTIQAELQGKSAKAAFIANETKIMDAIPAHLRDTTVEDLTGEVGTESLREDLTIIINRIIAPKLAITVLYKDILIR